jgi:hypothetical protein
MILVQLSKGKYILKGPSTTFKTKRTNCPPATINNIQIPVQTEVKYLGLYLDQKLTWQKHIKTKRQQLNLKSTIDVMTLRTKIQTFSRKRGFNIQTHIKADLDVWNSTMGMC